MRVRNGQGWGSIVIGIGCAVVMSLVVAGCGGSTATSSTQPTATTASNPTSAPTTAPTSGSGAATIAMGSGHFTGNTTITIKAGQSVLFDDTTGGPHKLVIGMHGVFSAEAGAPSQLNSSSGVDFGGGDQATITFPTAGTFNITCIFHPSMQATVTVTQ